MFDHITLQILERSQVATVDYYKMDTKEIPPIIPVRSIGKRRLAGVMDNEFPVFQEDRNRTLNFSTAVIKRVYAFAI